MVHLTPVPAFIFFWVLLKTCHIPPIFWTLCLRPLCWPIHNYVCVYKSPHPLMWPGWLCSCAQGEKRSWLTLRWQTALRTLAGLAGRPTASPAVNLCCILTLLKPYTHTHTIQAFTRTRAISSFLARQSTLSVPATSGCTKLTFSYCLSLYQSHGISLLLTDPKDPVGPRHEGHCHRINKAWINL